MDAYTIGLIYLALYITNKIIELLFIAIAITVVAVITIIVILGRNRKWESKSENNHRSDKR